MMRTFENADNSETDSDQSDNIDDNFMHPSSDKINVSVKREPDSSRQQKMLTGGASVDNGDNDLGNGVDDNDDGDETSDRKSRNEHDVDLNGMDKGNLIQQLLRKGNMDDFNGFDIEAWRQVHCTLIEAVQRAERAVSVQKSQRRYWLEELCSNLTNEGKLTNGSIWKRPVPLKRKGNASKNASKRQSGESGKKATAGAKRKKSMSTVSSMDEEFPQSTKKLKIPASKNPSAAKKVKKEPNPINPKKTKAKPKSIKIVTKKTKTTLKSSDDKEKKRNLNHGKQEQNVVDEDEVNASVASDNDYSGLVPNEEEPDHQRSYNNNKYDEADEYGDEQSSINSGLGSGSRRAASFHQDPAMISHGVQTTEQAILQQQQLALAAVAEYQRQQQQQQLGPSYNAFSSNESHTHQEPSYGPPTLKNYSSIQDIASDEDDSDQDRF